MRESRQEDTDASEKKINKALEELQAFDRKVSFFRKAQQNEQGETNFKVYEGLLPGEEFEPLKAKMRDANIAQCNSATYSYYIVFFDII